MQKLAAALALVLASLLCVAPAFADRRIIGTDEAPADAGPPPDPAKPGDKKKDDKKKKPDEKKPDEKKPDEKKPDEKKPEDKKPEDKKPEDKKPDTKKPEDKKPDTKKPDDKKGDVLEETAAEKKKHEDAEAKKKAAEKAAEEAAEKERLKKEEDQKKLLEEKKAADQKRKLENKDARLAAARRIRQITRTSAGIGTSFAIEPGEVKPNAMVEVRLDVAKKLEKADPRFGNLEPQKGLDVVVSITEPGAKKPAQRYAVHALDAPGRYGFHFTPTKTGQYTLSFEGKGKSSFDASFPLFVGVWPPPDFDDEEKNNLSAANDAARAGRKLIGGN